MKQTKVAMMIWLPLIGLWVVVASTVLLPLPTWKLFLYGLIVGAAIGQLSKKLALRITRSWNCLKCGLPSSEIHRECIHCGKERYKLR